MTTSMKTIKKILSAGVAASLVISWLPIGVFAATIKAPLVAGVPHLAVGTPSLHNAGAILPMVGAMPSLTTAKLAAPVALETDRKSVV